MKKFLYSLIILCLPMIASAQYFELTPTGFVSASDNSKKYIVLDFPGYSQQQLFDKIAAYLQTNPTYDVALMPEEGRILISGSTQIEALAGVFKRLYTTKYMIGLRFKDDRLRIDGPVVEEMVSKDGIKLYTSLPQDGVDAYFVFAKDKKIKNAAGKDNLETFFNAFANNVIGAIKASDGNQDDDDDW